MFRSRHLLPVLPLLAATLASATLAQDGREAFQQLRQQYEDLLTAHRPAVAKAREGTVALVRGADLLALGCVVHPDGWVLSKASELTDGKPFQAKIGDRRVKAEIARVFETQDLVLIQADADKLTPVPWSSAEAPALGSFVAAAGPGMEDPIAIGVYSVGARSLKEENRAFLGVSLDANDDHVFITEVIKGTPAQRAKLKVGDAILELDGKPYDSVPDLIDAVGSYSPGDEVQFKLRRGEEDLLLNIKLGKRPKLSPSRDKRFDRMNRMGGGLSDKLSGFPRAFQTDLPISPEECGGPVCTLDGKVVGINIARAGRIKTYAIPAGEIRELLADVDFAEASVAATDPPPSDPPAPKPSEPKPTGPDLGDIRKQVDEALRAVESAKRALEKAEAASNAAAKALKALESAQNDR